MKKFEVGKTYRVPGHGTITITNRSRHYITISGEISGRKQVKALFENGLFGLGEHIWLKNNNLNMNILCTASYETEGTK